MLCWQVERNYMVCFAVFTVLMTCAFLAATKFKFKDGDDFNKESIKLKHLKEVKDKIVHKVKGAYDASRGKYDLVGCSRIYPGVN